MLHLKDECIGHKRTSNLNLEKEVSTVGSPEELVHLTPTYNSKYRGRNSPKTVRINKRQEFSEEEKVEVSL